jgi:hypothetical protein
VARRRGSASSSRRSVTSGVESAGVKNRWATDRTEAFSDGVFARSITLLALDLADPNTAASEHPDRHRIELDEIGWADDAVGDAETVRPLEVAAFMIDFTRRLECGVRRGSRRTGSVPHGTSDMAGRLVFGGLTSDDFPRRPRSRPRVE